MKSLADSRVDAGTRPEQVVGKPSGRLGCKPSFLQPPVVTRLFMPCISAARGNFSLFYPYVLIRKRLQLVEESWIFN
jgi:hypothetical protein